MLAGAALRKTGLGYEFASEAALETFVGDNLQSLFGLNPIARQHQALGEFCDIIAVDDEAKQLSILELKNTEDRYIVQQLTRYYDNLLQTKPFAEQINYNQPIKLIAIAPSFHRHNHIDRKYNKLKIELLQVAVTHKNQNFYLQLTDFDTNFITEVQIPYQELDITTISTNVPAPPQLLLDWLGTCSGEEQQAILKMREQILSFDGRIKEEIERKNTIKYFGKSKSVAEIYYQRTKSKPVVFLWLPTPTSRRKEVVGRLRLWMDGASVTHIGHIPEGLGRMKLQPEWEAIPQEKRPKYMFHSLSSKSFTPVPIHRDYNNVSNALESLAAKALTKWLARI
jgi:RecB family endonuclease NucS